MPNPFKIPVFQDNYPKDKAALVVLSRDCFEADLANTRAKVLLNECKKLKLPVKRIVTSSMEKGLLQHEPEVESVFKAIMGGGFTSVVTAALNFGDEGSGSLLRRLLQEQHIPVMLTAATEEIANNLYGQRGDGPCGMQSQSFNDELHRNLPFVAKDVVFTADVMAAAIADFLPIARVVFGMRRLHAVSFGNNPPDFKTCQVFPEKLEELGIRRTEFGLVVLKKRYDKLVGDPRIKDILKILPPIDPQWKDLPEKMARLLLAYLTIIQETVSEGWFATSASNCWPEFETDVFGFVPCTVTAVMRELGIPVSCEDDVNGAISEWMLGAASGLPAWLADVNNGIPADMTPDGANPDDLIGVFHCGNYLVEGGECKYQLIMRRLMEPEKPEPEITRGTWEGSLPASDMTLFRLQPGPDKTRAVVAEGRIHKTPKYKTFGVNGILEVDQWKRWFRYALQRNSTHHIGVAFKLVAGHLIGACRMLGIPDSEIHWNRPAGIYYPNESRYDR